MVFCFADVSLRAGAGAGTAVVFCFTGVGMGAGAGAGDEAALVVAFPDGELSEVAKGCSTLHCSIVFDPDRNCCAKLKVFMTCCIDGFSTNTVCGEVTKMIGSFSLGSLAFATPHCNACCTPTFFVAKAERLADI